MIVVFPFTCGFFSGGQLSAWLRMRYPDVIAGAVSSSPTFFGAPGLGLVCKLCLTNGLVALLKHVTANGSGIHTLWQHSTAQHSTAQHSTAQHSIS